MMNSRWLGIQSVNHVFALALTVIQLLQHRHDSANKCVGLTYGRALRRLGYEVNMAAKTMKS